MPLDRIAHRPVARRRSRRLIGAMLAAVLAVGSAVAPAARAVDEEDIDKQEARIEGYIGNVKLDKGSTALTWLMFSFMALVGSAVLFKNANRTHLD